MTDFQKIDVRTDLFEEIDEGTKDTETIELEQEQFADEEFSEKNKERSLFEIWETSIKDDKPIVKTDSDKENDFNKKRGLKLFKAAQKWKGYVTEIQSNGFEARLKDLTNNGTDEEAWFSFKEISNQEQKELELGKVFYLSLGYSEYQGQVEKVMRLHFQKGIEWEFGLIDKVSDNVEEYKELFSD